MKSRVPFVVEAGLRGYLGPKLANDSKVALRPLLIHLTTKNYKDSLPKLKLALDEAVKDKMGKDEDINDVVEMLDQLKDVVDEVAESEAPEPAEDDDDAMIARLKEVLTAKGMTPEDVDAIIAAMKPEVDPPVVGDEDPKMKPKTEPAVTKTAMDAAIKAAEAQTVARLVGVREAEKTVRPYIGELVVAMDSADAVFSFALKQLGVDTAGVHPSAFPAILKAQPMPGEQKSRPLAMDTKASKDFETRFPSVNRLKNH